MTAAISAECMEVLRLLREKRNVLVSGPPAAGKSRLLNEVAAAFATAWEAPAPVAKPVLTPGAKVPIPANAPAPAVSPALHAVLPSVGRKDRRVFRTVFHQSSKHREFITGVTPSLSTPGAFEVTEGTLYRASEHAITPDGAALLIIDEINRGPAVQIFGGAIVAIECEKRLADDGRPQPETQYFELIAPGTGKLTEYALPAHLYILAAMNQADVSVEPLDVAFLRRWAPFALVPSVSIARRHFALPAAEGSLPEAPQSAADAYEALVQAWARINDRIRVGRGAEFEIGHGVIMHPGSAPPADLPAALAHAASAWRTIRAHIDEVFFGDLRSAAATLNAVSNSAQAPFSLQEVFFADEPRQELVGPGVVTADLVYRVLRSVAQ